MLGLLKELNCENKESKLTCLKSWQCTNLIGDPTHSNGKMRLEAKFGIPPLIFFSHVLVVSRLRPNFMCTQNCRHKKNMEEYKHKPIINLQVIYFLLKQTR